MTYLTNRTSSCLRRPLSHVTNHTSIISIKANTPKLPKTLNCARNNCIVSPPKKHIERIMEPTPPPIIKRIVTRLPTPEPSILEVVVKKPCQSKKNKLPESLSSSTVIVEPEPNSSFDKKCNVSPPRKKIEIIRDPTPEPIIKRIVTRLKTPEPDIIERIIIKPRLKEINDMGTGQSLEIQPKIIEKVIFHSATPICGCNI